MQVTRIYYSDLTPVRNADLAVHERLSLRWYERTWLYAGVGILSGLTVQLLMWRMWGYEPPLWLSFLAGLCYVVCFLFDIGATHLHVRQKRAYEDRGLMMPTCEANPLLPAYPTLVQQIWNITTLLSLLYTFLAVAMPGVGLGAALLHGLAGMGNYRAYRRSLITLQLFDARM